MPHSSAGGHGRQSLRDYEQCRDHETASGFRLTLNSAALRPLPDHLRRYYEAASRQPEAVTRIIGALGGILPVNDVFSAERIASVVGNVQLTQQPEPFFREVGVGPGVVCLHANASTSAQWRDLLELLDSEFHMLAADSYGAGRSPDWPSDRRVSLRDESALLGPVFKRAGDPFALVGHSYGGAVALKFAVEHPERVSALALYEPTLFAVIEETSRRRRMTPTASRPL